MATAQQRALIGAVYASPNGVARMSDLLRMTDADPIYFSRMKPTMCGEELVEPVPPGVVRRTQESGFTT
jgi:hypothetical protein